MWKIIPGFDEHYLVNEFGEVYSKYVNRKLVITYSKNDGYGRVSTKCGVYLIHRLVAMAFLGNEPDKHVNHKDGDKRNNCLDNLEWVTQSENAIHREVFFNNRNHIEKQTVLELYNNGQTRKEISIALGVSISTVNNLVKSATKDSQKIIDFEIHNEEVVKIIPGYDCYYASNFGRIMSSKSGKELSSYSNGCGYLRVNLYKNGSKKGYYVHRLVMMAFCGESKLVVNHINKNKTDNRLCNLEYLTQSANTKLSARRKLTESDKIEIRRLKLAGYKREDIAEIYNIGKCYVNKICRQ